MPFINNFLFPALFLDDYLVTIQELELLTGESISVDKHLKLEKPT
jgi:hypothetical protein